MAEIYALFSGRDGKVRYVGETIGCRKKRLERHGHVATGRTIPRVYDWIMNEWRDGYLVNSALLQTCADEVRFQVETSWISKFPNLLNERKYRFIGGLIPTVPEIRKYIRRYAFNVGGYRGVRYDRHWDCYQVFTTIRNGRVEWLLGDEMMPGWGGDTYFPDLAAAINARDLHRSWCKHPYWLSDICLP